MSRCCFNVAWLLSALMLRPLRGEPSDRPQRRRGSSEIENAVQAEVAESHLMPIAQCLTGRVGTRMLRRGW